jgi:hypothetical protein
MLTDLVARAYTAILKALPTLSISQRLEFYDLMSALAAHLRGGDDGEAALMAQDLCRRLVASVP